jgi:hypothetical protein
MPEESALPVLWDSTPQLPQHSNRSADGRKPPWPGAAAQAALYETISGKLAQVQAGLPRHPGLHLTGLYPAGRPGPSRSSTLPSPPRYLRANHEDCYRASRSPHPRRLLPVQHTGSEAIAYMLLILVRSQEKASSLTVNCGCQCSDPALTFQDGLGRVQGNCRRSGERVYHSSLYLPCCSADSNGAVWCYVDSDSSSSCRDLRPSSRCWTKPPQTNLSRFPSNPWSYEACTTPALPNPACPEPLCRGPGCPAQQLCRCLEAFCPSPPSFADTWVTVRPPPSSRSSSPSTSPSSASFSGLSAGSTSSPSPPRLRPSLSPPPLASLPLRYL